ARAACAAAARTAGRAPAGPARGGARRAPNRDAAASGRAPGVGPRGGRRNDRSPARGAVDSGPSVPNPKSVTKFGGVSTTLAALLLLGIAPTIPRRRALPAPSIHPRLWQRTSGPGHYAGARAGRARASGATSG